MTFSDHFSGHASNYASSRPRYPELLFGFLKDCCRERSLAWDCGTGNGQAATGLADHFRRVIASDASAAQLQQAEPRPNIAYRLFEADKPELEPDSVDLVMVAQALHWFDTDCFFQAVDSVLKPGGILAVLSYGLMRVDVETDQLIEELYDDTLGGYWPPQRRLVEQCYKGIEFPYSKVATPDFTMQNSWSGDQLIDYLSSWSAYRRYRAACRDDPMLQMRESLLQVWSPGVEKTVWWPLTVIVRRK